MVARRGVGAFLPADLRLRRRLGGGLGPLARKALRHARQGQQPAPVDREDTRDQQRAGAQQAHGDRKDQPARRIAEQPRRDRFGCRRAEQADEPARPGRQRHGDIRQAQRDRGRQQRHCQQQRTERPPPARVHLARILLVARAPQPARADIEHRQHEDRGPAEDEQCAFGRPCTRAAHPVADRPIGGGGGGEAGIGLRVAGECEAEEDHRAEQDHRARHLQRTLQRLAERFAPVDRFGRNECLASHGGVSGMGGLRGAERIMNPRGVPRQGKWA